MTHDFFFVQNKISQYGLKRRKLTVHVKSSTTDDGQDSGQDLQVNRGLFTKMYSHNKCVIRCILLEIPL